MKPITGWKSPAYPARAVRQSAALTACCGALALFLSGCASEPESHMVSAPPPPPPNRAVTTTTVVTTPAVVATPTIVTSNGSSYVTTTAAAPVANTMVITQAPPALQQEVVLAQPSPSYVWLPGYWTWRNDRY